MLLAFLLLLFRFGIPVEEVVAQVHRLDAVKELPVESLPTLGRVVDEPVFSLVVNRLLLLVVIRLVQFLSLQILITLVPLIGWSDFLILLVGAGLRPARGRDLQLGRLREEAGGRVRVAQWADQVTVCVCV